MQRSDHREAFSRCWSRDCGRRVCRNDASSNWRTYHGGRCRVDWYSRIYWGKQVAVQVWCWSMVSGSCGLWSPGRRCQYSAFRSAFSRLSGYYPRRACSASRSDVSCGLLMPPVVIFRVRGWRCRWGRSDWWRCVWQSDRVSRWRWALFVDGFGSARRGFGSWFCGVRLELSRASIAFNKNI